MKTPAARTLGHLQQMQPAVEPQLTSILSAASATILEQGYEAATTQIIAERAGMSVSTLHRQLPTKEAIITALYAALEAATIEAVRRALPTWEHRPLADCVPELVALILRHQKQHAPLYRCLPKPTGKPALIADESVSPLTLGVLLQAFVVQHRESLAPDHIAQRVQLLEYLCVGVVIGYLSDPAPELTEQQLVHNLSDAIIRYLDR